MMNRRDFAQVACMSASALIIRGQAPTSPGGGVVRQQWLDRHKEPILEPERPIIDPHHHLFVRPWVDYLADDLLKDLNSGHNVVGTVHVQCRTMYRKDGPVAMQPVGETEFVNGVAAMFASGTLGPSRACAGIVGQADLMLGSRVEPVLNAHLRAGGDRFRGIRHITSWDADSSLNNLDYPSPPLRLSDKMFREGVAVLARLGLSFDAMLYHPQIPELEDLARAFPELRIVLNHVGVPLGIGAYLGRRDEVFSRWAKSIKALAAHSNVFVKVGGLGMRYIGLGFNAQAEPPSSAVVAAACRPYVETCIEAFGAGRAMFESNFPVDKVSYSYPVFWNACKVLVKGASASEKRDLFAGTANRFYKLNLLG